MWRVFAVFYGIGFVLGLIVIANLLLANAELQLALAFAALVCAGVAIAFLTAIGLLAYAFNLNVPAPALWRPFGWVLGIWLVGLSLVVVANAAPQLARLEAITLVWLSLAILVNYFSWLGVWRYGRACRLSPTKVPLP